MLCNKLLLCLALVASSLTAMKKPCPSEYESCDAGIDGKKQLKDKEFSCWTNIGNGQWRCAKKENGACPYSFEDISYCLGDYKLTENKTRCPPPNKRDTPCSSKTGTGSATFGNPGGHVCWKYHGNNSWSCELSNKGICPTTHFDIGICPIDSYPPKCPNETKPDTKCITPIGTKATFSRPGVNMCWSMNKDQYYCKGYNATGACGINEIDISTCSLQQSHCPLPNQLNVSCAGPSGNSATFRNPGEFVCWFNIGSKFGCNPLQANGECGRNEISINSCTKLTYDDSYDKGY